MSWGKLTKAQKPHVCGICGYTIEIGETYDLFSCVPWGHPDNEGFSHCRACRFCTHMRYDALQLIDEDNILAWDETLWQIREYFYDLLRQEGIVSSDVVSLDTYANDWSPWVIDPYEPFRPCTGHPGIPLERVNGTARCPECANIPLRIQDRYNAGRFDFLIAREWNDRQWYLWQYPASIAHAWPIERLVQILCCHLAHYPRKGDDFFLSRFGVSDNVKEALRLAKNSKNCRKNY